MRADPPVLPHTLSRGPLVLPALTPAGLRADTWGTHQPQVAAAPALPLP